jgi:formylglycine-generating enzyme required for sulfatase activity
VAVTRPVILFLAANPDTTNPLRLGEECAAIERELKLTLHGRDFQLESRWAVSIDELIRHLNELSPTVVHFSGHGESEGGLLLQDEQRQPQPVSARALAMIVAAAAHGAQLVVLNACYTTVQADVLRTHVDGVVGMDGAIGDDAALAFAIRFYGALGSRRSVGNAVDQAVAALAAKQLPDELLPRCLTRDGVNKYQLFLTPPSSEPCATASPVPPRGDAEPLPSRDEGQLGRQSSDEEPPSWAVASGADGFGRWAAFEVRGVRQRMRWIPPGRFLMGSWDTELGRLRVEGPKHDVTLTRGYWLGETPVTQALWLAVMYENPSRFSGEPQRPVERVSWDDCQRFFDRLNGDVAALAARLPTEAEWERACRAGTTGATWVGELSADEVAPELNTIAWYGVNSGGQTHPVGRKTANPYGLHDMLGNVWEWCADGLRVYTADPTTDPVGDRQGPGRVLRGGSWSVDARDVRAASRDAYSRDYRYDYLGFRLAGGQEPALR